MVYTEPIEHKYLQNIISRSETKQTKKTTSLTVPFGETNIEPSLDAKILGTVIDSLLSWDKQISQITSRCYCILVGLAKLRHKVPRETKKLLVEALVFHHMQYCLTAWAGCNVTQGKRIQK